MVTFSLGCFCFPQLIVLTCLAEMCNCFRDILYVYYVYIMLWQLDWGNEIVCEHGSLMYL